MDKQEMIEILHIVSKALAYSNQRELASKVSAVMTEIGKPDRLEIVHGYLLDKVFSVLGEDNKWNRIRIEFETLVGKALEEYERRLAEHAISKTNTQEEKTEE